MKVKIGGHWYDSEKQPICIDLTEQDKKNIAAMDPDYTKYAVFPDASELEPRQMFDWMSNEQGDVSRPAQQVPEGHVRVTVETASLKSEKLATMDEVVLSRVCQPAMLAKQAWLEIRAELQAAVNDNAAVLSDPGRVRSRQFPEPSVPVSRLSEVAQAHKKRSMEKTATEFYGSGHAMVFAILQALIEEAEGED